jgi:hypothetical protein
VFESIKEHSRYARRGVSRVRIYKQIGKTYPGTLLAAARRAIHKALDEGILTHGETNARFKLTEKGKEFAAEKLKKTPSKNASIVVAPKSAPVEKKKKIKTMKKSTADKKKSAKKSVIKKKATKKKSTGSKKKSMKKNTNLKKKSMKKNVQKTKKRRRTSVK